MVITPDAPDPKDRKTNSYYRTEDEANEVKKKLENALARLVETTTEDAINLYHTFLEEKGTGKISRDETIRRFKLFFAPILDKRISRLDPETCEGLYKAFRQRLKKNGEPISADYHLNTLAEAKSFGRWCAKKGWLEISPLEEIEGVGTRQAGKEQHTGDEIRKLFAWCLWRAHRGDHAAVAILMALLMGLRSSDVNKRIVRDVDLDGTSLRVGMRKSAKSKSKKGDRPRYIPAVLQPYINDAIKGRGSLEPLFPTEKGGHHTTSWQRKAMERFCHHAEVPYVCPHALKGASGTVLIERGKLADEVAEHLSHEETSTGRRHYIADGAIENAETQRLLAMLRGKKPDDHLVQ